MDSPTKPSPPLTVEFLSAETTLEQIAIRVRLRLQVTQGSASLGEAARSATARAEVCAGNDCASDIITLGGATGSCDTAPGFGTVELASAALEASVVVVDFCIPTITNTGTYQTTVGDGQQESNPVEIDCAQSGGFLACGLR